LPRYIFFSNFIIFDLSFQALLFNSRTIFTLKSGTIVRHSPDLSYSRFRQSMQSAAVFIWSVRLKRNAHFPLTSV